MDIDKAMTLLFRKALAANAQTLREGTVFHAELALVFPDPSGNGKLVARNMPFKTERWLNSGLRHLGTMLEKMTVAVSSQCNRPQLKNHMTPGFTGMLIVINASYQPLSMRSLSTHAEDMLIAKMIMLDGTSRFALYRIADQVTDFPPDDEMLPTWELDEMWQLLLALDDLQQEMASDPAPEPEQEAVMVEFELYVMTADGSVAQYVPERALVPMELPANAQALRANRNALSDIL